MGKEFNDLRPQTGGPSGQAAALLLHEAVLRMCRGTTAGRVAVVLHLSRLVPPAPRPYHIRIVRVLLQDTAARNEGQVFTLGNGDMVLVCAASPPSGLASAGGVRPRASFATDPASLPSILGRLLRADMKQAEDHVSVWRLDEAAAALLAYTAARVREADGAGGAVADHLSGGTSTKGKPMTVDDDFAGQASVVDAVGQVMDQTGLTDLMQRQTAILLAADPGHRDVSAGLRPIFQEVTVSIAALEARLAETAQLSGDVSRSGPALADPFLFRHLAGRLDHRMLDALMRELGQGGPLDLLRGVAVGTRVLGAALAPVLHLNLTVPALLSRGFARLAVVCANAGLRIGIEVSVVEAMLDLARFAAARAVVVEHGLSLVLDGVSHTTLLIARPWALRPDLLKLDWSVRLLDLPDADRAALDAAVAEIDPARIVLQQAETEGALRWGVARGIRRFQGRHVDAMLGASRIVACSRAQACTLRQCVERSSAVGPAGRVGCHNLMLLDGAVAGATMAGVVG